MLTLTIRIITRMALLIEKLEVVSSNIKIPPHILPLKRIIILFFRNVGFLFDVDCLLELHLEEGLDLATDVDYWVALLTRSVDFG